MGAAVDPGAGGGPQPGVHPQICVLQREGGPHGGRGAGLRSAGR